MVRGVRRGDWSVKSVWEDMVELKSSRKGFCSALRIPWDLVCIEHGLQMKKVGFLTLSSSTLRKLVTDLSAMRKK